MNLFDPWNLQGVRRDPTQRISPSHMCHCTCMYTHRVNGGAQSQNNLFTITYILFMCISVYTHADQKRALDFQELELQVFMIELGAETELSPPEEGITGTVNH